MNIFFRLMMILVAMILGASMAFAQPDLKEMEQLIWQGKAEDAYNILKPYEFEQSGNVDFDYIFGLAALESGRPDQATLAFERVLAQDPNFLGARLDLARAWFALNLFELAQEELEQLQKLNPPPAAQKIIDKYLEMIEERTQQSKEGASVGGYLEARIGRDTNVNASPGEANVYIPVFGGTVTLTGSSIGIQDNYLAMVAGVNGLYRSDSNYSFSGGIEAIDRKLQSNTAFNTTDLSGYARVGYEWTNFALNVGAQYAQMHLSETTYRRTPSFGFDLRWIQDPKSAYFLYGQYIRQRYVALANQPNDADITLLGIGYSRTLGDRDATQCFISAYGGKDIAVNTRVDGYKNMLGAKAGVRHMFSSKLEGNINLGYQEGDYTNINPLFLVGRRDRIQEASIGLAWNFAKSWTLKPSASYFRSRSNIAIYSYDRADYMLALRYAF